MEGPFLRTPKSHTWRNSVPHWTLDVKEDKIEKWTTKLNLLTKEKVGTYYNTPPLGLVGLLMAGEWRIRWRGAGRGGVIDATRRKLPTPKNLWERKMIWKSREPPVGLFLLALRDSESGNGSQMREASMMPPPLLWGSIRHLESEAIPLLAGGLGDLTYKPNPS